MNKVALLTFLLLTTPACADPSCTDQVNAAFAKLRAKGAFRMETKVVNPQQGMMHLQADYVLPDRMHQKVSMGSDGATMDTIAIGKQAWSNEGEGWRKLPDSFAEKIAQQIKETIADPPKTTIAYKCLGESKFEGKAFKLFQGSMDSPAAAGALSNAKPTASTIQSVYVDETSGLPVRNIVTPSDEPDNRLFDGKFTMVENLKIKAPQEAN